MEVLLNVRHYRPGPELAHIRTYVHGEAESHSRILRCDSVPDALRRIDFATVECDIPADMTVPEYRRARLAAVV